MDTSKKEGIEIVELDSINPKINSPYLNRPPSINHTPFGIIEKNKQKRINILHKVIHTLAFLIILPYIIMVFFGKKIVPEYSTIVAIVIGFYFGKALLERE
ncbi:MAG: hypothetical protein NTX24_00205 [Candidatus Pacearchaeota archaeon]|nr:hypothetical protein [Candidatus Pacearchaeota archaeon]